MASRSSSDLLVFPEQLQVGSRPGSRSSSLSVFVVRDFDKHGLGVAPRGLQVSLRGSITIFYYARRLCNNCGKEASSAKRFGAEFCFIVFLFCFTSTD